MARLLVAEGRKRRSRTVFLGLILSQAAHSLEEWWFRLYDVLAPARFLSGIVSDNLAVGESERV